LAGDFAAGARGGSHGSDASGGKLPAVAGPEHGGRRSCYRLFRNFMVPLQQPPAPRPSGRAAGPGTTGRRPWDGPAGLCRHPRPGVTHL
jgi:hypothetical protein